MIEERQYTGRTWKFVRTMKGLGNKVMTGIDNAGLKVGDAMMGRTTKFKFKPKSSHQLNRETIQLRDKAIQAKGSLYEAALNPGSIVDKGVEMTARNPLTVASQVGGKVAMVSGNPVLMATPVGAIGTGAEQVLKRKVPAYGRVTERLGDRYHNSPKLRNSVVVGTNSALMGLRNMALL